MRVETISVVEDDDAVRRSLSFLLESAGLNTLTFSSAELFFASADAQTSRCVVADVRMPGLSGMELLQRCRTERPKLPVILITAHGDISLAVEAMKMGAADFLEKPYDETRLIDAIKNALLPEPKRTADAVLRNEVQQKLSTLSEREREVLTYLADGNPNKAIARALGISVRTIEIHRARVMAKMQARSLADLVRMTISAGILDSETAPTH